MIKITNKKQILLKIIIAISSFFLTYILSNRFKESWILIGAISSFIISTFIIIKYLNIKTINKIYLIISLLISSYTIKILLSFCNNNLLTNNILGILSLPVLTTIVYLFIYKYWSKIKDFFKSLTKSEKLYLKIIIIIATILAIFISYTTTAFTKPIYNKEIAEYDVIYTSDTGILTKNNAYINVSHKESDIRQPLFGVFSLPFSIPAKIASEFLFFIPNAYEMCLMIMQFLLTTITTIMIGRMLNLEEKDKKYLYILFSCSFPYILFNIVLEQYTIALFYLILALYVHFEKKLKGINYYYIPATGTLLTTGIIFPIITKFKNIKQWLIDIIKCGLAFVSFIIISGQLPQVFELRERYLFFSTRFTGKISLGKKLCQFTNFIKGIFVAIPAKIAEAFEHPSYQLVDIKTISIIGILILLICIISTILNRKNKFCITSGLWILFSILILLIIGWGTVENGLVLYSLYFAWAYLSLYFMFIKKVFKSRKIFISLILITSIIMIIFNITEFINIIKFAIKYY